MATLEAVQSEVRVLATTNKFLSASSGQSEGYSVSTRLLSPGVGRPVLEADRSSGH